jgi:hypothetical protein
MTLSGLRGKAAALPDLCKVSPLTRVPCCFKFEIHQAKPTFHLLAPSYQPYFGCYVPSYCHYRYTCYEKLREEFRPISILYFYPLSPLLRSESVQTGNPGFLVADFVPWEPWGEIIRIEPDNTAGLPRCTSARLRKTWFRELNINCYVPRCCH